MYILFTLFFVSLLGIIFMIVRKHILIHNGHVFEEKDFIPNGESLEELKEETSKKLSKLGFVALVIVVRLYVKFSDLIKNGYRQSLEKIRNVRIKKSDDGAIKIKVQKENKFLKMVGQYKKKIRKIKDKVRQEENL